MILKIFIVDDSIPIVERLINLLSVNKHIKIVGVSINASNTLEAILKSEPDVVILDIHMQDGNGLEILRQLKRKRPAIMVIMLTNYTETVYRTVCKIEGADYFLDKSIEFEKVLDICRSILEKANKDSN